MNALRTHVSAMLAALVVTLAAPAQFVVTQSLDPASPECTSGAHDPAGLNLATTPCPSPAFFPWTRAALGIPAGGNVDAFTDCTDIYPPASYMLPPATPGQTQVLLVDFSVDRTTVGISGSPIANEASTDGAAGDTFGVDLANAGGMAMLMTDHLCLTPLPNESNIDAICWNPSHTATYPVYYSVDAATAVLMQGILPGVTEADVIRVGAAGQAPAVFVSRAGLGLSPGDDIDALASMGGLPQIVYSLSRTSPTAIGFPLVGSAGLFTGGTGVLSGYVLPWAYAFQLGMNPGTALDNLDAVRILYGDPAPWGLGGRSLPGTDSCNGVNLSTNRPVLGLPLDLTITAPIASGTVLVAASVPNSSVMPLGGCNLYLDPATGLVHLFLALAGGTSSATLIVPNTPGFAGASFRIQAGLFEPGLPNGLGLSNPVTLIVGAF